MRWASSLGAALVVLSLGVAHAQPDEDGLQERSMQFARGERTYLVHTPPSYDARRPTPAVLMLHGRFGNGRGMAALSEMNAVADRYGFLVIYPDGIGNEWTEHMDLIDPEAARRARSPDDVAFLSALADHLRTELNADPTRTYVAGFSNGGFMTIRLSCEASDRFAAFASVGAALHLVIAQRCERRPAAPILLMHGNADPNIPYQGLDVRSPQGLRTRLMMSVPDTAAFMMRRNHCSTSGTMDTLAQGGASPGTTVQRFEPQGCDAGKPVVLYTIDGGGHTWPGVRALPEENFGLTNMDINASEVIWRFFEAHTLPPP